MTRRRCRPIERRWRRRSCMQGGSSLRGNGTKHDSPTSVCPITGQQNGLAVGILVLTYGTVHDQVLLVLLKL